jgi:uncharacterized protein (TIGR04255 family)
MGSQPTADSKPLHFTNPPIVEAIIAIDVSPLPDEVIGQFRSLTEKMALLSYKPPTAVSQHQFEVKINAGDSTAQTRDIPHGLRFDSQDGLYAVHFNRTGFICSRLGKYERWESFRDEARKTWDLYSAEIGPAELKDYGVRYINKIFWPSNDEVNLYLRIYPQLPPDIPRAINQLFMRLEIQIETPQQGKLIHQQILLPQERENYATLLLDNDFRFSAMGLTPEKVWERLESVRQLKDDYFCKFVTPRLMETFNV